MFNRAFILLTAVLLPVFSSQAAKPTLQQELNERIRAFHQNTPRAMQSIPRKYTGRGQAATQILNQTDDFVAAKQQTRVEGICSANQNDNCYQSVQRAGRAPIGANDRPEDLVDAASQSRLVKNLDQIERNQWLNARLQESTQPWSDTYWPIYQGQIANRYPERGDWISGDSWQDIFNLLSVPSQDLNSRWSQKQNISKLSPAEKYDLLIGLSRLTSADRSSIGSNYGWRSNEVPAGFLTPHQWGAGKSYWDRHNDVERWMGLCHGWAPAAYLMDRPTNAIEVPASDDPSVKITFYPSDMKALATYFWAQANTQTRFIGGRCDEKNPVTDSETGRVTDQDCFDSNPATWHLAVVHQISSARRSFVMDATYDYEVWNQPVLGYSIAYFDPMSDGVNEEVRTSTNWRDVARTRMDAEFQRSDKFRRFRRLDGRNDYYTHVVGVIMEVEYLVETNPSTSATDSSSRDATRSVRYVYDLEVNQSGEPVGGEWYENAHPDFLWTIDQSIVTNRQHDTSQDSAIRGTWNPSQALPASWRDLAREAAVDGQVPLAKIVEALIRKANE